ncbi:MAG: efflux RND transporter periplasmic adaptor subunit [Candidatus Polarisedimenticolia bacterium]
MRRLAAASAWTLLLTAAGCSLLPFAGDAGGGVTVAARKESVEFHVPAQGYLEAVKSSPIAVPRVPTGALKVKEVVPEGTIVEPGEIILVFDDTQLNIELDNHKASFRSADRRIDKTATQSVIESGSIQVMRDVAELQRDTVGAFLLNDENIFSRLEILDTEVRKETAEETILFADASLLLRGQYYNIEKRILGVEKGEVQGRIERVETSLGNLVLKAPIGGLITYKKNWRGASVGVGDTLWPGNMVLSIVDPTRTALLAYVLEKDAAGVKQGADALVTADARPDRTFKGKVQSVAEVSRPIERNSPVKYSEVRIEIETGDPDLLKPGMKAEARIVTGKVEDAIVVPRTAVRGDADAPWVLVAGGSAPQRREVTLGPGDLARVSVTNGLGEGDQVIVGAGPTESSGSQPASPPAEAARRASGAPGA